MTSDEAYIRLIAAKLAAEFAEVAVYFALWELTKAIKALEARQWKRETSS